MARIAPVILIVAGMIWVVSSFTILVTSILKVVMVVSEIYRVGRLLPDATAALPPAGAGATGSIVSPVAAAACDYYC